MSVLVAEDDADDLFFLKRVLGKTAPALEVHAFPSGRPAIDFLSRWLRDTAEPLPSVAFIDVRMPDIDGFGVLRWIRSHSLFDRLAVVVLTSSTAGEDIAEAARLGAQCYLSKHLKEPEARLALSAAQAFARDGATPFPLAGNLIA